MVDLLALNLHRRHLTAGQKAGIAVEALPAFEDDAKERRREAGEHFGRSQPKQQVRAIVPGPIENTDESPESAAPSRDDHRARDDAARAFGISPRYVQDAKRVKEQAPDLFEQVKSGTTTLPQASKEAAQRELADAGQTEERV